MEKWTDKRVAATLQYLGNITSQLETWEERLAQHTSGKKSAKTMVAALTESKERTIEALKEQGAWGQPIPAADELPEDFGNPPDIEAFTPGIPQLEDETEEQPEEVQAAPKLELTTAQKRGGAGRTYIRHRTTKSEGKLYDD